jgi:hypothetical protein
VLSHLLRAGRASCRRLNALSTKVLPARRVVRCDRTAGAHP